MATECYSQLGFGFQPKLVVDFAGGTLTTDAGLVLVREFDEQLRLSADVVSRVTDPRDPRYITHAIDALVRQRLYQIVAGYEDVNDADRLRHDPTFQVVAADGRTTLGSQPTLSRLENAIDWSGIQRLARTGVDWFCAYAYGPDEHPADLILDLDSTDDPTHGTQQLALFHGWYDQHMYHPLVWFEGRTGLLLRTRLRPGRDASATGVVDELRHILPPLRRRFPHTPIFLRADAGMATPAVEANLEAEGVYYVLGIGTNRVFKARVAPLVAKAQARYERRARPVHIRTSFWHRAKSWSHHRRILVKIDVTAAGLNVRFMVTNRRGRAADLIALVRQPGDVRELDQGTQARCPRRSPQLSSLPRERLPSAAPQPRAVAARVLPSRRPRRDTIGVGDRLARSVSTCSKSPGASSGASVGSGFIWRRIGPGTRSSRAVTARLPARPPNEATRDIFLNDTAAAAGGVVTWALGRAFGDSSLSSSRADNLAATLSALERVVTVNDRALTDSFVNNAG